METGYLYAADETEIAEGKMKKATVAEIEILIANVNGSYFAVGSECTHFGGDLSEGTLEGKILTCPIHKAKFDVTTGKVASPPAEALSRPDIEDLPTYLVRAENNRILVKL